jgi:lipoate---protein ligase
MTSWQQEFHRATPAEIHKLMLPDVVTRMVRWHDPLGAALVLGSTQPESDVDIDAARSLNIDIVRRRSGGGAVLVAPGDLIWFDVVLPNGDPLWAHDVGRAFHWLGHAIADTLAELGTKDVEVHEGALLATQWSRRICFAGVGPGECRVGSKKIVGISQRRTRFGAIFQVSIIRRFDGDNLARLLSVPSQVMVEEVAPNVGELAALDPQTFSTAFLQHLDQQ